MLTFSFGSSDKLAGAYGTAVSTTMLLTTALLFNAMRDVWRWPVAVAVLVSGVFLLIDLAFFGANLLKIREGGWIPLLLGAVMFVVDDDLAARESRRCAGHRCRSPKSTAEFLAQLDGRSRGFPGPRCFFSRSETAIPPVLVRHVAQIKALQETVVSLTVRFEEYPRVPRAERAECRAGRRGLLACHRAVWLCRNAQRGRRAGVRQGERAVR